MDFRSLLGTLRQTARRDLPASFYVGGGISGGWGGAGWLHVSPGVICYEPGRLLGRLSRVERITQASPTVVVVKARLLFPAFDSGLLLFDGTRFVRLLPWFGRLGGITAAIRAAGFTVEERRTWISLGWRAGRQLSSESHAENH